MSVVVNINKLMLGMTLSVIYVLLQVLSSRKVSSEKNLILKHPNLSISPLKQFPSNRKSLSDKDLILKPPSPRISPHKHVLSNKKTLSEKDSTLKHQSLSISPLKHVQSGRKPSSEKESTLKHPIASVSPLKNKNVIDSPRLLLSKPISKELKQSTEGTIPSRLIKVPLSFKTWSDAKILWDSLPSTVHDLGKV